MATDEQGKKLGQVLAKAWEDAAFKQRLPQDATLRMTRGMNATGN
ncbi:MAG: hypothetical protein AAGU21_19425 [Solidesulfovibrio sp.]|nr:hypothetical protein [Solidesulfovibrio sp.]MEA4856164.1 hypothetical protein [Solidesulfovibrio sp.]